MAVRIKVNGRDVSDPSALPSGLREACRSALKQAFADTDGDGIPDVLEKRGSGRTRHTRRYVIDGKVSDDPSPLPLEAEGISPRAVVLALVVASMLAGALYYALAVPR